MDAKATAPKVGGGAVAVDDDFGGDGMQCSDHPYRNNATTGGICALCLQEKLGKLVSSSSSSFFIASSPSFRSDNPPTGASISLRPATATATVVAASSSSDIRGGDPCEGGCHRSRRARMRFLLAHKSKEKAMAAEASSVDRTAGVRVGLKRCKSSANPGRGSYFLHDGQDLSPRRRRFWSFLHHFSRNPSKLVAGAAAAAAAASSSPSLSSKAGKNPGGPTPAVGPFTAVAVDGSPANSTGSSTAAPSFGRKVSRSRSVGCGSRSFSGDLFERISTGLGDCTLRRVESHREGKRTRGSGGVAMGERVRCGGIFGGFMTASSTSSSSSSSYWVSRPWAEEDGKGPTVTTVAVPLLSGRSWRWGWGWAFASPRRAFSKPTTGAAFASGRRRMKEEGLNQ